MITQDDYRDMAGKVAILCCPDLWKIPKRENLESRKDFYIKDEDLMFGHTEFKITVGCLIKTFDR